MLLAENKNNILNVAIFKTKIIGWIQGFYTLRLESDSFVEIGDLVVHDEYRNKGVDKLLVESISEWTKNKECETIRVRCNTKRIESHIFYAKINFQLNKEQKIFDKKLIY
ncbi:MAG: GNAT family N-acetyltransferase [Limnohabitans sp.]|nr:GNAT family N-acetyltransferase [Limnohabitans sp.]